MIYIDSQNMSPPSTTHDRLFIPDMISGFLKTEMDAFVFDEEDPMVPPETNLYQMMNMARKRGVV